MQMADLVHHFYQWYDSLASDRVRNINFIDDKAKHLKLDSVKLKTYLDYFRLSGFVNDAFKELHFTKNAKNSGNMKARRKYLLAWMPISIFVGTGKSRTGSRGPSKSILIRMTVPLHHVFNFGFTG